MACVDLVDKMRKPGPLGPMNNLICGASFSLLVTFTGFSHISPIVASPSGGDHSPFTISNHSPDQDYKNRAIAVACRSFLIHRCCFESLSTAFRSLHNHCIGTSTSTFRNRPATSLGKAPKLSQICQRQLQLPPTIHHVSSAASQERLRSYQLSCIHVLPAYPPCCRYDSQPNRLKQTPEDRQQYIQGNIRRSFRSWSRCPS